MHIMYIIQRVELGYDDYPIGQPYDEIGPFATYDAAKAWAFDAGYSNNDYTLERGVRIIPVTHPDEWKPRGSR